MSSGGSAERSVVSLQGRLIDFLDQLTSGAGGKIGPGTEIFTLGLFDSLALVELVTWVEQEMGDSTDLSDVDFRKEWPTVADIVAFIQRAEGRRPRAEE